MLLDTAVTILEPLSTLLTSLSTFVSPLLPEERTDKSDWMGTKCASCAEVTYITNPEAQQKELAFVASVVNPDLLTPYSFPDLDNPMNRGVSLSDGSSSL